MKRRIISVALALCLTVSFQSVAQTGQEIPLSQEGIPLVQEETPQPEGEGELPQGESPEAEGEGELPQGESAEAEGEGELPQEEVSEAEGEDSLPQGETSQAEGIGDLLQGESPEAEGESELPQGESAEAEGEDSLPQEEASQPEGEGELSQGETSQPEGIGDLLQEKASSQQPETPGEESAPQSSVGRDTVVPTPAEAYQAMIALADQDAYKEGTPWTNDEPYSDSKGYYSWKGGPLGGANIKAVGCVAFAFILSDAAFGSLPARMYAPGGFTYEDIKVGDILRVSGDAHTVIVLEVSDAGVVVAEGNISMGDHKGKVHWGRAISREEVMRDTSHYITRYPEGYIPPDDPEADVSIGSGTLEGGLTWNLTKAGTLTVSGGGAMPDFSSVGEQPWNEHSSAIREVVIENGVTSIGACAFWNCGVLGAEIAPSVTSIGNSAFRESSIVSVTIPSGVKTIGDSAFRGCANLGSVTVSEGVEKIDQNVFRSCGKLGMITLPSSIGEVGAAAFFQCEKLGIVTFTPGSRQVKMGDNLFAKCYGLMKVTLPKSIDRISEGMFQNCLTLAGLEIPEGAESIGGSAFASSAVSVVIIPDSVTSIGIAAFGSCPLEKIYYTGSEEQWKSVSKIGDTAAAVAKAEIIYNYVPSPEPSTEPSESPKPSAEPTESPKPSTEPTETPDETAKPTESPDPSTEPTQTPDETAKPTESPKPSAEPTESPKPSAEPTESPKPSAEPTEPPKPSAEPTESPKPSTEPTESPKPSAEPTESPKPSTEPSQAPNETPVPTQRPEPTSVPTQAPSQTPAPVQTPEPTPVPTAVPTPVPTSKPGTPMTPSIEGGSGKEGWEAVKEEAVNAFEGKWVNVNMNGASVVPGDVLDRVKGQNVTISFNMGNGIIWFVNGKNVTADRANDVDFSVKTATSAIPENIVKNIAGDRQTTQLSLAHSGDFGYSAVLMINVGAANVGKQANLFYYNESGGRLEFISSDQINDQGIAELNFTHASDYVIIVGEDVMGGNAGEGENPSGDSGGSGNESNSQGTEKLSPKTGEFDVVIGGCSDAELPQGGNNLNLIWLFCIVAAGMAAAGSITFLIQKKVNKKD